MEAEREAALAYWSCWAPLHVRFVTRDRAHVPEHWHAVGTRHSPLASGPRVAVTPVNAILNYLYAILESETRIACLTLGLDPGLGIWHADYRSRDSFVLDLMEAARPNVDRYVLETIQGRSFTRKDIGETSRGICRLLPAFAAELAQTARHWRDAIAPHAEHTAKLLAETPTSRIDRLATPLTRTNRTRANGSKRPGLQPRTAPRPQPDCKLRGDPVSTRERTYCDTCIALPQGERYANTLGLVPVRQPEATAKPVTAQAASASRTSRACKRCGDPVGHRKRVLCDPCFVEFRAGLAAMRRPCKGCGAPVPHRKRVYCDACVSRRPS